MSVGVKVAPRLLRLAGAECTNCGAAPRIRITEAERELHRSEPPDQLVGTVQCHRHRCNTVYPIFAEAYQGAA